MEYSWSWMYHFNFPSSVSISFPPSSFQYLFVSFIFSAFVNAHTSEVLVRHSLPYTDAKPRILKSDLWESAPELSMGLLLGSPLASSE